jgi:hypothetical protein
MQIHEHTGQGVKTIQLPASTYWPIVLALGITLVFAGIVTSPTISLLGAVFSFAGAVGWFRQVLPHEAHEEVPVDTAEAIEIISLRTSVARIEISAQHRARSPVELR